MINQEAPFKILIAEDDRKTADLVRIYLERNGYIPLIAHNGRLALELARQRRPDLIILDLMLPKVDGLDICRILRAESNVPIIMLTARSTEDDRLLGLDLGADDYVVKPFSPRELVARVRAVLRRTGSGGNSTADRPEPLHFGQLTIDYRQFEVRLDGTILHLTPKEFKILETMSREPGRVFSRGELMEKAFGLDYEGLERTIDVHVRNLRRKLADDPANPQFIHTVYGIGYKFASRPAASYDAASGAASPTEPVNREEPS